MREPVKKTSPTSSGMPSMSQITVTGNLKAKSAMRSIWPWGSTRLMISSTICWMRGRRTTLQYVDEIGGILKRANRLFVSLARPIDAGVYSDPDRLDITRRDVRPLSFGGGIHYCVGVQLARIEAEIAIATLLRRLPNPQLDDIEHPDWRQTFVLRGLNKLPAQSADGRKRGFGTSNIFLCVKVAPFGTNLADEPPQRQLALLVDRDSRRYPPGSIASKASHRGLDLGFPIGEAGRVSVEVIAAMPRIVGPS
jgi:hypothetical protein